jgi:hypothetical protein
METAGEWRMKRTRLAMLLLLTQASFAAILPLHAEDLEEGISYPYPFVYEDESELESKADSSKDESPTAWHGTIGKAKVTVDVENTDYLSQCQAKWDSMQKKNKPEKRKSRFKDDDEDHFPRVSASIKWSTEN